MCIYVCVSCVYIALYSKFRTWMCTTYVLSDLWIFTHLLLILRHTVSWLDTRLRFLLTRATDSRVFTLQNAKMANRTSSGRPSNFRTLSTTEFSWDMNENGERPWHGDFEFFLTMLIVFHTNDKCEISKILRANFNVYSEKSWRCGKESNDRNQHEPSLQPRGQSRD
jgi:hypothetical protein